MMLIQSFNSHYVMAAVFDPSHAFFVGLDSDFICRLITGRMRNEDASEAVSDAESAGTDDDDYEEMMLKKRKLEKRLSSQYRTAGCGSGSLTGAKEYMNAVLSRLPRYGTTRMVAFRRIGEAPESTPDATPVWLLSARRIALRSLLDDKLMYHLNENISR
ncbi:hypothetical protein AAVH_06817 [Aphelenchoides avenae]|nr:hypothetical protein AAVH_06817 [Aphelenchus avenae]